MKILFVDQTGKLAGAERVLLDLVPAYQKSSIVALFEDGPFREALEKLDISVEVLSDSPIEFRRESKFLLSLESIEKIISLVRKTTFLAKQCDLIYVNTPKALVVGALASYFSRRPMVYHLHDILTPDHFSGVNRQLMVTLANRFATKVIAVSEAAKLAFIEAGGRSEIIQVVYNGFDSQQFQGHASTGALLRSRLNLKEKFVVGHFSRLSPWKGQHVLIESLRHCPEHIHALIVGDALFGEHDYAQQLRQQVENLELTHRVQFLGFRTDVPQLMAACNVIAHTSTAPEPCARVLIEAMLSGKPLVASKDGGTLEIIQDRSTGWFVPPGDSKTLAHVIKALSEQPENTKQVAEKAQHDANIRFPLAIAREKIDRLLQEAIASNKNNQFWGFTQTSLGSIVCLHILIRIMLV